MLTTVNAVLQRVAPREIVAKQSLSAAAGTLLPMARVTQWLELNGFTRAATVREPGDYAVRGGIVDLFAPGMDAPVRLDFFGDTLESIRRFDPETQRTTDELRTLELVPMAEFQLTAETIRLFRTGYVAAFGAAGPDDMLYEAVSDGRRTAGMEHWLPLFHPHLDTLFDYLDASDAPIAIEPLAEEAAHERLAQIADYYQARKEALDQAGAGAPYKPLPPDRLYLPEAEWRERLEKSALARLSPFAAPEGDADAIEIGARAGHNFAAERSEPGTNVFEAVRKHVETLQAAGKRVVIALWSDGSRERMAHVLAEHGLFNLAPVAVVAAGAGALPRRDRARRARPRCRLRDRRCRADHRRGHFGRAAGAPAPAGQARGEFHRRGDEPRPPAMSSSTSITASAASSACAPSRPPARRTTAWKSITPAATSCSCRSRTSSCCRATARKRPASSSTGSAATAWQSRKARMKNRIREMAGELIKIAAERQLREAPRLTVESGLYDEFCAGFPYEETDDQQAAIAAVLADLASGRPMDRLICGDVGFGKTEVALRAAFIAAMNGKQVAVVVPTTLLARQHMKTFSDRLARLSGARSARPRGWFPPPSSPG